MSPKSRRRVGYQLSPIHPDTTNSHNRLTPISEVPPSQAKILNMESVEDKDNARAFKHLQSLIQEQARPSATLPSESKHSPNTRLKSAARARAAEIRAGKQAFAPITTASGRHGYDGWGYKQHSSAIGGEDARKSSLTQSYP